MNKIHWAVIAGMLLSATPAMTATLSILPLQPVISVGDTLYVQLNAELVAGEYMSLPDIDVLFDDTLLDFNPETGVSINALWGTSSVESFVEASGVANLTIKNTPDELDLAWQNTAGGFVIGTLRFSVLAPGVSDLLYGHVEFFNGDTLVSKEAITLRSAQVQVNAVPVPSAALLFTSLLLGVAGLRRRLDR